jgi:nitroimidazol reductase NimA-like FMN-containing flavoprotein (pyridoxamine 5'-phosphate oxidase superfamily)
MGDLTTVGRHSERGHYDADTVAAILDATFVCQVGFVNDGVPIVLPTIHARSEEVAYIHGSSLARWLTAIDGAEICLSVSLVDGIVFARSAFNHSLNYRSVVAFGRAVAVNDPDEKLAALHAIVERVQPGRWNDSRQPNAGELKATTVLRIPLDRASAKVRSGPPIDASGDYDLPYWAGVMPIEVVRGKAISDPKLRKGIAVPAYLGGSTS